MSDKPRKLLLTHYLSPGDVLVMTAAVRDLHLRYPGRFLTDVDTSCNEIWEHNKYITKLDWEKVNGCIKLNDPEIEIIKCDYDLIHESNSAPYHFIHGFARNLEDKLGVNIRMTNFRGDIHLSDDEKSWMSQVEEMGENNKFWIIIAGGKYDFTAKWWDPMRFQAVVDHFRGKITFVQCGEEHGPPPKHFHPQLKGVIDLRGKTDLRQFIRLVYHSVGILCPVTFGMHLAAAVEMKHNDLRNRPCVVVAGGREPCQWEMYPHHQYIHKNGSLRCCGDGGCWSSRCQPVNDGDPKDHDSMCKNYVQLNQKLRIAKCMDMISSAEVIHRIQSYYDGGVLQYNEPAEHRTNLVESELTGHDNKTEGDTGGEEPVANAQE